MRRPSPETRPARPPPAAPAPAAQPAGGELPEGLAQRLEALARARHTAVAGKVHFIGFAEMRARLGEAWTEALGNHARMIARSAMSHHLAPGDIVTEADDKGFVIVFGSGTEAECALRAAAIGADISRRLLGDSVAPEVLRIDTIVRSVEGRPELTPVDQWAVINRLLDESIARNRPDPASDRPADDAAGPDELDLADIPAPPLPRFEFCYRPVWDATRSVISAYRLIDQMHEHAGAEWGGPGSTPDHQRMAAEADLRGLAHAATRLGELLRDGHKVLVIVPVHWASIAIAAHRIHFLEACERIAPALQRLLLFEMVALGQGVPQTRLVTFTSLLKPFCRAVLARLPSLEEDLASFQAIGLLAVSVDLSALRLPEATVMHRLNRLANTAANVGLRVGAFEVRSLSLALTAFTAGIDYIDGPAVFSLTQTPSRLASFSLEQLYVRRLGALNACLVDTPPP